jgi:hypothetical protein
MAAVAWETISLGTDTPGTLVWFHSVQSERSVTNLSTVPPRGVSLHDLVGIILYHNNVLSHLPLPPKGPKSLIFKVINPRKWSSLRGRLHRLRWMHALLISCRSDSNENGHDAGSKSCGRKCEEMIYEDHSTKWQDYRAFGLRAQFRGFSPL